MYFDLLTNKKGQRLLIDWGKYEIVSGWEYSKIEERKVRILIYLI